MGACATVEDELSAKSRVVVHAGPVSRFPDSQRFVELRKACEGDVAGIHVKSDDVEQRVKGLGLWCKMTYGGVDRGDDWAASTTLSRVVLKGRGALKRLLSVFRKE